MIRTTSLVVVSIIFMAAACGLAGPTFEPATPTVTISSSDVWPVIDGRMDRTEWSNASSLCGFVDIQDGELASQQPQMLVTRDKHALMIGARFPLPKGKQPVSKITDKDGEVWTDDAIEVFLQPQTDSDTYYQFIVNAGGAKWDSNKKDPAWNAPWEAATSTTEQHWTVEIYIPFAVTGAAAPDAGDQWGLNVAWDRQTPAGLIASWANIHESLHSPHSFGRLQFAEASPTVQLQTPAPAPKSGLSVSGRLRAAAPAEATLSVVKLQDGKPAELGADTASHAGDGSVSSVKLQVPMPTEDRWLKVGRYSLNVAVSVDGNSQYVATAPFSVQQPLKLKVEEYTLEANELQITADIRGMGKLGRHARVACAVVDADGNKLQSLQLTRDDRPHLLSGSVDISELSAGDYDIRVIARRKSGKILKKESVSITIPKKPQWLGSNAGITDEVLPPWTPVRYEDGTAQVWGRQYQFGPLPIPKNVVTAGESILAAPVSLNLVADGNQYTWHSAENLHPLEVQPDHARLKASAAAGSFNCSGTVSVQYDGMIRTDLQLSADDTETTIDELALIVPIKKQFAKYLYHYPGKWRSSYNAGALDEDGFVSQFKPFIWLGNNDLGLAWFSESDKNFFVDNPDSVIEITPGDDVVKLRVNLISGGHTLDSPLDYTFGFQATPVKPVKKDVWDYRICHHGSYGIQNRPWHPRARITYPAEGNINLDSGTFEAWVKPAFDTEPDISSDDADRGRLNRNLFTVKFKDGDRIGFYWNIDDRGMRVYYRQDDKHPLVMGAKALTTDEWHHVAFTWGERTRIFVDGNVVAERHYEGTIDADPANAEIILGEDRSEFAIEEVRISDIARDEFDLSKPRPLDEHTLLLDRMDGIDPHSKERQTGPDRGKAGTAVGGKVVLGKWGYAFALYKPGVQKTVLDRLAELGVRTIVFHEHWTDIQNYTSTTHEQQLHDLVEACHERGIKLLLYFGYEMSNIAPEWDKYSEECLVKPRRGGYERKPQQKAYIVCYNSAWQDFIADGIARTIDKYDIDGVYLDGTANPWACKNRLHGCGYKDADGNIHREYQIFAAREMMRRIYAIVKSRKPDGLVNVHQSTCMTIPTLSWATSYWDGEQFGSIGPGPDPLEILPLDAFRTEFMGHQWGVPAEFLCYNRPYTYHEAMSFTLLHDVLVRGRLNSGLETEAKLWKGMEEFGRDGAVYLPYWENSDYVSVGPDSSVKASIYTRSKRGAVIVVSNLGEQTKQAEVNLDLKGLSLTRGNVYATDMITGDRVYINDVGQMDFPLDSFDYRVMKVRPIK